MIIKDKVLYRVKQIKSISIDEDLNNFIDALVEEQKNEYEIMVEILNTFVVGRKIIVKMGDTSTEEVDVTKVIASYEKLGIKQRAKDENSDNVFGNVLMINNDDVW